MKFIYCLFFTLSLNTFNAFSEEKDSILIIKNNPFFVDLMKGETLGYSITITNLPKKSNEVNQISTQHLIKSGNDLFLLIDQGGVLYKASTFTNSTIRFIKLNSSQKEIDATHSYVYTLKNQLYIQGGYADGQNNGTLRNYNRKTNHWEIIPLNKQVIHQYKPFELIWLDAMAEKIIVPFQGIVNDGISEEKKLSLDKKTYALNLKTSTWTVIGKINKQTLELLNDIQFKIDYANGFMVESKNIVYMLDFKTNQVMKMNNALSIKISKTVKSSRYGYVYNDLLYSLDSTLEKYDSISLDKSNFSVEAISVYNDNSNYYYPIIPLGILLIGGFFLSKRKKQHTAQKITTINSENEVEFTDGELALISLFVTKSKKNKTAVISEINYVLGVKDKNTGLQKKVRSDTISSINEKFKINLQSEELIIQSIRSEIDKRYLEYFINKEFIKAVEQKIK
jgi:hypothetical protein